jgi:DDE superfamily endonuclease
MCVALLVPVHWAARVWALPFLTALCPSERYNPYVRRGRRHKPLVERARGLLGQVRRWLPERPLIVVADSSYAALELLAWCTRRARPVTVITRLRLDAALYRPAPARRPGQNGRPRLKGQRLPTLARRLEQTHTRWQACRLCWYGGEVRRLQLATATAVWYSPGKAPVAIRWVLVRDPKKRFESQALLSTDLKLEARQIVLYFIRRWSMETTFQEARLYLGMEGQRQWNDLATARATPVRLALFSLVTLLVQRRPDWQGVCRRSAWYQKARPTFADALAQVRRALWRQLGFWLSEAAADKQKPAHVLFEHFAELLAYVA